MTKNSASKIGTCLSFHWGTSRGRDTYGYAICTLKANGYKVGQCDGGGYDMKATSLAEWMKVAFQKELVKIGLKFRVSVWDEVKKASLPAGPTAREVYGLALVSNEDGFSASLDGGCGLMSMERILKLIGLRLVYKPISKKDGVYMVEKAIK